MDDEKMTEEIEKTEEIEEIEENTTEIVEEIVEEPEEIPEETIEEVEIEPESSEEAEISAPEPEISEEIEEKPSRIAEFEQKEAIEREYDEFKRLFPGVSVKDLPETVREAVNSGVPLAAAYALFEKRRAAEFADAENINLRNSELSAGSVKEAVSNEIYYSPREVREMSPDEVHKNFSDILRSMNHWKSYTDN